MAAITAEQRKRILEIAWDVLSREDMVVTEEGGDRLIDIFGEMLEELVLQITGEYFVLLSDAEAVEWLVRFGGKTISHAKMIVRAWRKAVRVRVIPDDVKIHAVVRHGVRLKTDVPYMGNCQGEFSYIQTWIFPDEGTHHALVSWVPVPLAECELKDIVAQRTAINVMKTCRLFPMSYVINFGSAVHVAGMALAHFRATGEEFAGCVRTETVSVIREGGNGQEGGRRLILGWSKGNLYLNKDRLSGEGYQEEFSVFAVGVVNAV